MKSLEYLAKIRKLPCCVCVNKAEPHHLKAVGMGRNRAFERMEHFTVIPLCRMHHSEIHSLGVNNFEEMHRVDPWKVSAILLAERLWEKYGDF